MLLYFALSRAKYEYHKKVKKIITPLLCKLNDYNSFLMMVHNVRARINPLPDIHTYL